MLNPYGRFVGFSSGYWHSVWGRIFYTARCRWIADQFFPFHAALCGQTVIEKFSYDYYPSY